MGESALKIQNSELDKGLDKFDRSLEMDLYKNIRGKIDSLRRLILSSVVDGNYDAAISELRLFEDLNRGVPYFKHQTERYFGHCEELIRAIDSKTKFSYSKSITRTQKQELHSMVRKHFRELSDSLRKIETIENNIKVQDLRSTNWVIKTVTLSIGVLLLFGAIQEAKSTMVSPFVNAIEHGIQVVVKFIFS